MSWLLKCCHQSPSSNSFQTIYLRVTHSPWNHHSQDDINSLLNVFQLQSLKKQPSSSLNFLFQHLNVSQPSVNLTNLFILDQTVDEQLMLDQIWGYNNSILAQNKANGQYVDIFMSNYFQYIREKAKLYSVYRHKIFNPDTLKILKSSEQQENILKIIEGFMDLHSYITKLNTIFQKMTQIYRQLQLLNQIMIWMLKNHLMIYRMVSASFSSFLNTQNQRYNAYILERMKHLLSRFNKEYVKHLRQFIKSNIKIKEFHQIQISEIKEIQDTFYEIINSIVKFMPIDLNEASLTSFKNKYKLVGKNKHNSFVCHSRKQNQLAFEDKIKYHSNSEIVNTDTEEKQNKFSVNPVGPQCQLLNKQSDLTLSPFAAQFKIFNNSLMQESKKDLSRIKSFHSSQTSSPIVHNITPIYYVKNQSPEKLNNQQNQQCSQSTSKLDQSIQYQPYNNLKISQLNKREIIKDRQQKALQITPVLKQSFKTYFQKMESTLYQND